MVVVAGKGRFNAMGNLPDVAVVLRIGARRAAQVVDGVNVVVVLLEHNVYLLLGNL